MPLVERIRFSFFVVIIILFFIGCMHPDRAGDDRMARSGDRAITGGDRAITGGSAITGGRSGDRSLAAGERGSYQEGATALSPQAQNPDVVRAAGDDAWSPAKSAPIAQVSGHEQTRGNPGPSTNISPAPHSPTTIPSSQNVLGTSNVPNPSGPKPAFVGAPASGSLSGPSLASVPDSAIKLRELYNQAALRFATIDSYVARLRRREQVKGKDQPEELILFKFRKRPWSVYFKWLGAEGQGREVVYVKGQHGDMIHSLLAAGDMPLAPPGKHMALSPDNIFVRSASRHAISEAGIGVIIEKLGQGLEAVERGDKRIGTLTYLGPTKRPEYPAPLDAVEHTLPPGLESQLPRGGRHWIFFDPVSHLPVLLITHDDKGHEVEYYCYDRLQFPVKLDDLDFDPEKLWPGKK